MKKPLNLTATLMVMAATLCACAGTQRVEFAATPTTAPEWASSCVDTGQGEACDRAFTTGARLRDRRMAGQALVLAAPGAPEGARREVALLGAWLNPRAWASDGARALVPAGQEVPDLEVEAGAILAFEGARGAGPVTELALRLPEGAHSLTGQGLAARLAAAAGADGAVVRLGGADVLVPATPQLNLVLGAPLGGVPARDAGAWAWAHRLAEADRAWAKGELARALRALREAIAAMPEGAPPCDTVAALHLLDWRLGLAASDGSNAEPLQAIDDVCVKAEVGADQQPMAAFLREVVFLEARTGRQGAEKELVEELYTARQRQEWRARLEPIASGLGDDRGALLLALMDELIVAYQEPTGPCDKEFHERVKAQSQEITLRYERLGRDDYAATGRIGRLTDGERLLQAKELRELLTWAEAPEHRWVRQRTLTGALTTAAFAVRPDEARGVLSELCDAAFAQTDAEVQSDRGEGSAGRNATRLFAALSGMLACPDRTPVDALTDRIFKTALEEGDGHTAVLTTVVYAMWQSIGSLLSGQGDDALRALGTLRGGLTRVQAGLGSADEDRALSAVLLLVVSGVDTLTGQQVDLGAELASAGRVFKELSAKPVTPEGPTILKLTPGFHLATLGLRAAWGAVQSDEGVLKAALDELDASLDGDVQRLLQGFGLEARGDAIGRLVRAGQTLGRAAAADQPDLATARAAAIEAERPGEAEAGWWRIGLDVARVVIWDLNAALATDPAQTGDALGRADAIFNRMIPAVITEFELEGTGWELLTLAPAAHRAVYTALSSDDDAKDLQAELARAVGAALREGLYKTSTDVRMAAPDELGFLAVVRDALLMADEVGLENMVKPDGEALHTWAKRWSEQAVAYSYAFRFLVNVLTSTILFDRDPARALKLLDEATEAADEAHVSRVGYAPDLFRAWMLARTPERLPEAVASLDKALAAGDEARSCGAFHEVDGALPFKALVLHRLGKPKEADAALATYLELIQRGFAGDGRLQCNVVAYRPNFTSQFDVSQNVQNLFFATSNEGAFNIGAGFESHSRTHSRMTCTGAPLAGRRHDLELNAHLLRALFALLAGDDKAAHLRLLDADRVAYRLVFGSELTLDGADVAGLADSQERIYFPLLAWVGALSHAAGHFGPADNLKLVGDELLRRRGLTWEGELGEEPPAHLRGLGLDELSPLVRAWIGLRAPEHVAGYEKALKAATPRHAFIPPALLPLLVAKAQREVDAEGFKKAFNPKKVRAPRGAPAAERLHAMLLILAGLDADPAKAPLEPMLQLVAELSAAGHFGDVVEFVARASAVLWSNQRQQDTLTLTQKAVTVLPGARAPRPLGMMLLWLMNVDPEAVASSPDWSRRFSQVIDALHGTIDPELELRALYTASAGLARAGDYAGMKHPVTLLRRIAERGFGPQHALTLNVQIMDFALDADAGKLDLNALRRAESIAASSPDLDPPLKELLRRMAAECENAETCRVYARTYLESFKR